MGVENFSRRPSLYRAAIALLTVSLFLAFWGVIAPGWKEEYHNGQQNQRAYVGLRWSCTSKLTGCTQIDLTRASDISKGTFAMSCIGLFFLGVSTLNLLFREFCASEPLKQKRVYDGAFIIASGMILFAACMIFVNDDFKVDSKVNSSTVAPQTAEFGPSFILTLVASLSASLAGLVIFCYASTDALKRGSGGGARDDAMSMTAGPYGVVGPATELKLFDPQGEAAYASVPVYSSAGGMLALPPPPAQKHLPGADLYRSFSGRSGEAYLGDHPYRLVRGPSGSFSQFPRGLSRVDSYATAGRYAGVRNDGYARDPGVSYVASPRLDYP